MAESTEEKAAPAKGGKKKIALIAGPLVLALAAAWFLVGPGASTGPAEVAEPIAGEVISLEPITLNLADGRLLRLGLALQMEELAEEPAHPFSGAMAMDEAITLLGSHTYAQLSTPEGQEKAKAELSTRVAERYEHGVMEVLFTEFLMQ